ncbi:MAG: type IV pilus assembly protein PilM [Planctomycetota bacterium]
MAQFTTAWGLDIGQTSIKAVKLVRAGTRINVAAYAVEPIEHGEDVDRDAAVADALRTLVDLQDGLGHEPVYASLSGRQVFSKTINLPVINPKTVHRMVELEARQQIPGNFDDLYWSYHLSPTPQDDGSYDVALFATRKTIVEGLIARCGDVGIKLAGISVTGLAVYNFVAFDQDFDDDESVIVLDVGAENTDLVVYQGEALWLRNLRVSGNDITKAFMKRFKVSFEEAERLKQEVNQSNQADRIARVIEPALNDLVAEIKRSLGFYKSHNPNANFRNVVVCGNTFRLELLGEHLANQLGYPLIALVELEHIGLEPSMDHEVFLDELQGLSTAMGLALQAVGRGKANVNLLPADVVLQQTLAAKRWSVFVAAALLIAAFAASYFISARRLETYTVNIADIEHFVQEEEESREQAVQLIEQLQPLAQSLNQFDRIGYQRAAVHATQARVLEAVNELVTRDDLLLPEPTFEVSQGADPIRQPIYLESIELPPLGGELFDPTAGDRTLTMVLRMPASLASRVREVNREVIASLRNLGIGPELASLYGLPESTPLFAAVTAPASRTREDAWRYIDGYRIDPTTGNADPLDEQRRMEVSLAEFQCQLAELEPVVTARMQGAGGE